MLLCVTQEDLASSMMEFFSANNFTVEAEQNGLRVIEKLREKHYDVVVLEMVLKGLDGLSVIRSYRKAGGNSPIMLLTGSVSSEELQNAFNAGADAYLAKPFRLADLHAQLRAMLRRPALRSERILSLGNLAIDTESGTVTKNDEPIRLFPMEYKLLRFLMKNPNQVFDARAIFERVWQKEGGLTEDTVRTHIRTLRKKIDTEGEPSFITTVRGLGYRTKEP